MSDRSLTAEEIRQFCATYGDRIKVREQVDGRWIDVPLSQLPEDRWEYHVGRMIAKARPMKSDTRGENA